LPISAPSYSFQNNHQQNPNAAAIVFTFARIDDRAAKIIAHQLSIRLAPSPSVSSTNGNIHSSNLLLLDLSLNCIGDSGAKVRQR
jgi:hypothetical protein